MAEKLTNEEVLGEYEKMGMPVTAIITMVSLVAALLKSEQGQEVITLIKELFGQPAAKPDGSFPAAH